MRIPYLIVPYVRSSASTATSIDNSEPLETHGLFQNYQSFHHLSGDTEKEACTAAYHDLTNLMLSQTEESSLINVSSSRLKTDEPFPCGLTTSNEMKKKHDKLHLQWPPQSDHHKVINRTLALYQHGPPPKSGTTDKWPPPPVQNPCDKTFVPKEFPTTHKIPSTMPKRWDLHASFPLMLRPPQSTAVPEVPDSEISKSSSWLEAFAARAAHTSTMSATSMVGVYNFQQKVLRFIRDSASKNDIQNDISLVDDLIQRANSMALEAHIMAHDSGVTATELFTHLHMLRPCSVLDAPTVALHNATKTVFWLCLWEVMTSSALMPARCTNGSWKRKRRTSSSSPEFFMKEPNATSLRRSLLHQTVVLPVRSRIDRLWMLYRGPNLRTLTTKNLGSPFGDLPSSPPTRPTREHSKGLKRSAETDLPPPLTEPIPMTRDSVAKTRSRKVSSLLAPLTEKVGGGGGEAVRAANRKEQLPVGEKLVHFKDTWMDKTVSPIVRKVSQGILIAFDDALPSLLHYPLELPNNNKTAYLLHAVQKH